MKKATALAVVLLAASILPAAEPLKITGAMTVPAYTQVKLAAENAPAKAGIIWKVFPANSKSKVSKADSPKGKLQFVGPPDTYTVSLMVITVDANQEVSVDETETTVVIGDVPNPIPPPKPPPDPVPPVANVAFALVVEETATRDVGIARVLMDQGWTTLGISYRFYDKDSAYAQSGDVPKAVASAGGVPALILLDKSGQVLKTVKLPGTFAEVKGLVKP